MLTKPPPTNLNIPISEPFLDLWEPNLRHIFYVSGRDSGKSWGVAEAFIILAMQYPYRFLVVREVMKSLERSVYQLLADRIRYYGLEREDIFTIKGRTIECANGSLFEFAGMQVHTVESIKSFEGVNFCFIEEAQTVSKYSLGILIPTIRKEIKPDDHPSGQLFRSKIVYAMNPRYSTDEAYKMAVGYEAKPNPRVRVHRLSWRGNDFLSMTSLDEIRELKERDPEEFEHRYEGGLLKRSDLQVYKRWSVADGPMQVPSDAKLIMGADWGFSPDPAALIRAYYWKDTIYITDEACATNIQLDDLPAFFAGNDTIRPNSPRWQNPNAHPGVPDAMTCEIVGDSSRNDVIAHMKAHGFNIRSSKKGPNSIIDGIGFIRAHDIIVAPHCSQTLRELVKYQHKPDKDDPDKPEQPPKIVDKHNHLMDALRYACEPLRKPVKRGSGRNISTTIVAS